jgi:uncharacterized membrane protein
MPLTSKDTPAAHRYAAPLPASAPIEGRLTSLDIVRGLVMVLMAIDHVRVYSGLPAGGPTAGIFFTRWVTHFCAPAFVFLAGTGAFLHGKKLGDPRALARYLVTRGMVLLLLEMTLIRVAWTFNLDYAHYLLAGVIWMLGWCMILLAALVRLPTKRIGIIGLTIVFAQNLIGVLAPLTPASLAWFWQVLYFGGPIELGSNGPTLAVLYSIVTWIGVMAAGYAFGAIMVRDAAERRRLCLQIGLSATALFIVVGGLLAALRPAPSGETPALFRFLNPPKYPASQLFLLMTLGPTIALLPFVDGARGKVAEVLATFGRAPLFYYLLHLPLIHALALVVSYLREGRVNPWLFANHPMMPPPPPPGYAWSLPLMYLVFVIVVTLLYVPCRWFARLKARRRVGWLTYI